VCVSVVVRLHNIVQVHAIYGALQGIPELKYLL
jgi:putative lipoic acid-binding regulatory protein